MLANTNMSVSPDGRFGLFWANVPDAPRYWGSYQDRWVKEWFKDTCAPGSDHCELTQCFFVDMQAQRIEPMVDAPRGMPTGEDYEQAAWVSSGNRLVLVNAILPLMPNNDVEQSSRTMKRYFAEIELPSRKIITAVEEEKTFDDVSMEWDRNVNELTVLPSSYLGEKPAVVLRRTPGGWTQSARPMPIHQDVRVRLEEDVNTPPMLTITNLQTNKRTVLLDLNPQFANLQFAHVELIHWKPEDGEYGSIGGLYYPDGYVPGRRYPLVIQPHGFIESRFWIAGPFTTAFAAQPLAAKGFFVLQMSPSELKHANTAQEGPDVQSQFDAAVDYLDKKGLIDPQSVGILGFSRDLFHVMYTLTHPRLRYTAAVVADGVYYGFGNCLLYMFHNLSECEAVNGGGPPAEASLASNWIKNAIDFNLDKVTAPLLLQSIFAFHNEGMIYRGLRWLNKPAEQMFFPSGEHELVKPMERLTSSQAAVDWFRFWIKHEEDSDPAKAGQYARWRDLQKADNKQAATDSAPVSH